MVPDGGHPIVPDSPAAFTHTHTHTPENEVQLRFSG
jgi:hypothetical protein